MMQQESMFRFVVVPCLVLFSSGCSENENVEVFPVRGVVNFEGKPMAGGGAISFIPTVSQKGKNAGGIINPDGTFVMTTYVDGDGAMMGSFRVIINQTTTQEPENTGDSDTPGAAKMIVPEQSVAAKDQIPFIYGDPVSSPVTVTIEAKEQNELTIDLSRNAPGSFVPGA